MYRIGSGAGFSGDRADAAIAVVAAIAAAGEGGAIMFETLGERTLALGQIARRKDAARGYEPLLEDMLAPILRPAFEAGITIVGNFGAANPPAAAAAIRALADRLGIAGLKIAIVTGDDLHGQIDIANAERWDGDGRLPEFTGEIVAVNAYIGARAIAEAITSGADVVVTGRVADPALALGPLVAHFGWDWNDLDRIAAGTLAGHLLECGAQVTGGYFADPGFKDVPRPAEIGFPIAEVEADGGFVITKPAGTGGLVSERTVKEQLLYEIHDPAGYLTPDVTLDISEVTVRQIGEDRVRVEGARGRAAPEKLKVTVSYHGDFFGEAEISYAGPNALNRARLAQRTIRERIDLLGLAVRMRSDIFGTVSVFDADSGAMLSHFTGGPDGDYRVRFAFDGEDRKAVERAVADVNALYCCGPAGGGGVRQSVRPRVRTLSYLAPRSLVTPSFFFLGEEAA
ncbi:acyclic terpene utilization AtuA family protein [Martelella soudanensis]|uniref:acyclic terpene utilization AtuA family protein n=1 Tax=unclassified Martelella TaxID=2629616 RepID=UPI0015DFF17E|nr:MULTISPECIES: acyclic terpene utilization AtuA family protein [unclassified Martelella]